MLIGVPKEIKNHEYRVGLTPSSVRELIAAGHHVLIESNAGAGIGLNDEDYQQVGAELVDTADEIFAKSDMIIKVKEPQAVERKKLRSGQILFTYLHLAPDPSQTKDLVTSDAVCIAYETVTSDSGQLPLLAPMSEVAGRMSIQAGAQCLEKSKQGRGMLMGGVPGVQPAKVVIIGGGVVGRHAAQMAIGLGAQVTILDRSLDVLRRLNEQFGSRIQTIFSSRDSLEDQVLSADCVIGSVLIPGAEAPKLVSHEMIKAMKSGAAVVDVAIDQGGCFATSHPTTHDDPIFITDEVVHYCVANMPGAVPRTSTFALNHATLPFILQLANQGYKKAFNNNLHLMNGLNVYHGQITNASVAESLDQPYVAPAKALKI